MTKPNKPKLKPLVVPTEPEKQVEFKKLPRVVVTAILMQKQNHARAMESIAQDALLDMGLKIEDGWRVYPDQGIVVKEQ